MKYWNFQHAAMRAISGYRSMIAAFCAASPLQEKIPFIYNKASSMSKLAVRNQDRQLSGKDATKGERGRERRLRNYPYPLCPFSSYYHLVDRSVEIGDKAVS
jgi:hypothetical protein